MDTVCIFGDSIAHGANDNVNGGWAGLLKKRLLESKIMLHNCSVSGDTTTSVLMRIDEELRNEDPGFVIFAIGTNDSAYRNDKTHPLVDQEVFFNNIKKLASHARQKSLVAFIGLIPVGESKTQPVTWDSDIYYTNENIVTYNELIENFCRDNFIPFINMMDCLDENDLDDGLHPNTAGHEKMFEKIKGFILGLI